MPKDETEESLNILEAHKKAYEQGQNDAWELARTIFTFNTNKMEKVFGFVEKRSVFDDLTPQEALAKLKAYEYSKIEVGDIVLIYGEEAVVTRVVDGHANILFGDGVTNNMPVKELVGDKTGKHIDIKSFLEQIGGRIV
jgi:cobalamin biosynthesis Co2+ chelatase CbiK